MTTNTATKAQLERRARALGVILEYEPKDSYGTRVVEALAPNGKRFAGDGVHALIANAFHDEPIGCAYASLLLRMEDGLEDCDPKTCDSDCWNDDGTLSSAEWLTDKVQEK